MSAPPTDPVAVAPLGPAAAVKSVPTLTLPVSTLFTAEGDMIRSTTSVDEPPTCRPALAPPMVYMAGADHSSPLKFLPLRQVMGPRPPVPPTPTANFFTPGKTRMQLAVTSRVDGTTLLSSIACNTAVAFLMVSSSLALSTPHAGRVEIKSRGASNQDTAVLIFKVSIQRLLSFVAQRAKHYIPNTLRSKLCNNLFILAAPAASTAQSEPGLSSSKLPAITTWQEYPLDSNGVTEHTLLVGRFPMTRRCVWTFRILLTGEQSHR